MSARAKALAQIGAALVLFGTLGLFVRMIGLPPLVVAATRGLLGAAFLLAVCAVRRRRPDFPREPRTLGLLVASGIAIGLNWLLLFAAYERTTLATAELAYEMAPVWAMLAAPFVLDERLSRPKIVCLVLAVLGMAMVSGLFEGAPSEGVTAEGIALGLAAALFFAAAMILNQLMGEVEAYAKSIVQLACASACLVPFALAAHPGALASAAPCSLALLAFVGVVHTGLAFTLWFASMDELSAQSVAILEYIDPVVALAISVFIFHEHLSALGAIGAVLVLGSMVASEFVDGYLIQEDPAV